MPQKTFFHALSLGVAMIGSLLCAAPKTDLSRITPVAADQQIPISDFFRLPMIYHASINRGGTKLAAIVSDNEDKRLLMIHDLATKKTDFVSGPIGKEVSWFWWQDDSNISFSLVKDKWRGFGLFSVSTDNTDRAYPLIQYCAIEYLGSSRERAREPLVWISFDALGEGHDLGVNRIITTLNLAKTADLDVSPEMFTVVRDQNERHIAESFPRPKDLAGDYMLDHKGDLAFAFTISNGTRALNRFHDGKWIPVPINLEDVDIIDAGNQTGQVVGYVAGEKGKPGPVVMFDTATGAKGVQLFRDTSYDFRGSVQRNPMTGEIIGLKMQRGYPTNLWFSEGYKNLQKKLNAIFPEQYVDIVSINDDQDVLIVSTSSDRNPTTYHWVNTRLNTAGLIKNTRPWIDPARMSPMSLIKFNTRDGYKLDAYLSLPKGATKEKPAPLIVLPHGGPWVRDTWGWDGEVQFLASRGYAVLQPNYRGSLGYDFLFTTADRWDFLKMQQDVSDATKAACANPLIDPDRVAIMGWSFGGYHAIAGAEEQPCPYRCAIALSGVYDIERMMKDAKQKDKEYNTAHYEYMTRFMGTPDKAKEKYEAMSPINHLDSINIPIFVSHGKEDTNVDASQSKRLVSRLKQRNIPVEFMLMSNEGHGTRNIDHTVELYTRIEAFLAKNLAPRAKPAAAP
jgi:acetyl esterase/lipase